MESGCMSLGTYEVVIVAVGRTKESGLDTEDLLKSSWEWR